jgi:hypothetical protein
LKIIITCTVVIFDHFSFFPRPRSVSSKAVLTAGSAASHSGRLKALSERFELWGKNRRVVFGSYMRLVLGTNRYMTCLIKYLLHQATLWNDP